MIFFSPSLKILDDIKKNDIQIFDFPDYSEFHFEKNEVNEHNFYKSLVPFAVISSNQISIDSNGKRRRVRKYQWGEIDGEISFFLLILHI